MGKCRTGISTTRRFDGKLYTYHNMYSTKREATLKADGIRRLGSNARIVRVTRGYAVYRR